jgi:DNA adenine methylase
LAPTIVKYFPEQFGTYIEPFCGSLAVFFELAPKNAVLMDSNKELINFWNLLKDKPADLLRCLKDIEEEHLSCDDHYLRIRKLFNLNDSTDYTERAAQFCFLNKYGFNGLWRQNSKGHFNVPEGTKDGRSIDYEHLLNVSGILQELDPIILCKDFSYVKQIADEGDLIYFDPPYVPIKSDSFTKYSKDSFTTDDHQRLADTARLLSNKASVFVSNSEAALDLYPDCPYTVLLRSGVINSDINNRQKVKELLINAAPLS